MGIVKLFIYTLGGISSGLFISLRLGKNLEISCRHTGQIMGLFYRYLKVILFNLKPKSQEPGEIVRMMRNINQQSHAFTRELQENLGNSKRDLSDMVPALKSDYLNKRKQEFSSMLNSKLEEIKKQTEKLANEVEKESLINSNGKETKTNNKENNQTKDINNETSNSILDNNENLGQSNGNNNQIKTPQINLNSNTDDIKSFLSNMKISDIKKEDSLFPKNNPTLSNISANSSQPYTDNLSRKSNISGVDVLEFSLLERRKIISKKKESQKKNENLFH